MEERYIRDGVLSDHECRELIAIHRAFSSPAHIGDFTVTVTTPWELLRHPHYMVPIMIARERVRELVEEQFGAWYDLSYCYSGIHCLQVGGEIAEHADTTCAPQRHFRSAWVSLARACPALLLRENPRAERLRRLCPSLPPLALRDAPPALARSST